MTDDRDADARARAAREAARVRRARRAWIAANHPDRGGDPRAFDEGLRRLGGTGEARPRPTVHRSRSPWRRLRRLLKQVQRARRGHPRRHLD